MNKYLKIIAGVLCSVTFSMTLANTIYGTDRYYAPLLNSGLNYTVLDAAQYQQTVKNSRLRIQQILAALQPQRNLPSNAQVALIASQLQDTPYTFTGAMGEGDWRPAAWTYQPGAVHIQQDPIYRLDGLDCLTFTQVALGLLYAKNLDQFDKTILKIAYGAAGNPLGERVHYFNRNNFVDGDWNPVNESYGWLSDATKQGELATHARTVSATLTRQNWFSPQRQNLATNVKVLTNAAGPLMAQRFTSVYAHLNFPHFNSQKITVSYLPKEKLALVQADGGYQPNMSLLEKIPTPAVVEIIRDPKKWQLNGKNIKDAIGSELTVSHIGLLYRHTFAQGDVIYQKMTCSLDGQNQKVCDVQPVICQAKQCHELMFVHATDAHPNGYYWYQDSTGKYVCSATLPTYPVHSTQCNRVVAMPLFDYLTDYQYGSYHYMSAGSILGIHLEKINVPSMRT